MFISLHAIYKFFFLTEAKIDDASLIKLNENDLVALGIPLGPRKMILDVINRAKHASPKMKTSTKLNRVHHVEDGNFPTTVPFMCMTPSTSRHVLDPSEDAESSKHVEVPEAAVQLTSDVQVIA